jgi:hypothetical protein
MLESAEPIEEEKVGEGEDVEEDDAALIEVVDQLWDTYDDDGNGYLDMDETRNFILNIMAQVPNA